MVQRMSREESEEYFKTRPTKSQIGALASDQSQEIENRSVLEKRFEELHTQYATGNIPMPESWGGYKVEPNSIEFWQGRRSRLHDRIKYEKTETNWTIKRLAP